MLKKREKFIKYDRTFKHTFKIFKRKNESKF